MLGKLFGKKSGTDYAKILEEKIDSIERPSVAQTDDHRLFMSCYELGGYHYLHFDLVGPTKVRTASGGRVTLIAAAAQIDVETDSEEIETDFNKEVGIGATGFDIDKDEIVTKFIDNNTLSAIEIRIQSKAVRFDRIHLDAFKDGLIPPVIPDEEE